jgi:uncharacterized membrane protein YagU involved in acid resistance
MNRFWKAVLLTTLVAGTLDIIAAHIHVTIVTGTFPTKMFYGIAAHAIGLERALQDGPTIFAFGVFIHYFISFSFTLFFFLVYPVVSKVLSNKYLKGLLYTVFVWLTMGFIVLPLTVLPPKPFVLNINQVIGFFILMVVFGMPISLMIDKYYKARLAGDKPGSGRAAGFIQG